MDIYQRAGMTCGLRQVADALAALLAVVTIGVAAAARRPAPWRTPSPAPAR